MRIQKITFFRNRILYAFILILLPFFIVRCGQSQENNPANSVASNSSFSSNVPPGLQKIPVGTTLTANLVVDGGTAIGMDVDLDNNRVTTLAPIDNLSPGTHIFIINYFLDGTLIASATAIPTIISGQTITITPDQFNLNADLDADGVSGIDEVLAGADPNKLDDRKLFAYVANFDSNSVTAYTINSAGSLNKIGVIDVATGDQPQSIFIHPTGQFAYVPNNFSRTVRAYKIDPFSGVLTRIGVADIATGSGPIFIAVDRSGKFAYVANVNSRSITAYRINTETGTLTKIGQTDVATGASPRTLVIDRSGKFVYVANFNSDSITAYTIDAISGALTKIGNADVATGSNPFSLAVDPGGRFAYVSNTGSNTIRAFKIDAGSGVLAKIGDIPTGIEPISLAVDPKGKFLYVANRTSNSLSAYLIAGKTGILTRIGDFATGTRPRSVTVDPGGRFVYVANQASNTVTAYTIDRASGDLSRIGDGTNGGPAILFSTGTNPVSISTGFGAVIPVAPPPIPLKPIPLQ